MKSFFGFIWRVKDLLLLDFPGGALDKNLPANAGDTGGSISGPGFPMPRNN